MNETFNNEEIGALHFWTGTYNTEIMRVPKFLLLELWPYGGWSPTTTGDASASILLLLASTPVQLISNLVNMSSFINLWYSLLLSTSGIELQGVCWRIIVYLGKCLALFPGPTKLPSLSFIRGKSLGMRLEQMSFPTRESSEYFRVLTLCMFVQSVILYITIHPG